MSQTKKQNTKWLTSTFWALVEMWKWTKVQQSPHGHRQRAAIYVSRRMKTQQLFIFSQFIQVQTHKCIFYVSACQQTLWNVAHWAFKCEFSTKEDFPLFFSFFPPLCFKATLRCLSSHSIRKLLMATFILYKGSLFALASLSILLWT